MLPRICLTEMGFRDTAQTVQNFQPEEDENHIMLTIDQTLLYYSYCPTPNSTMNTSSSSEYKYHHSPEITLARCSMLKTQKSTN